MLRRNPDEAPNPRRWLLLGPAVVALAFGLVTMFQSVGSTPIDSYNYLAAGERLNAGHDLYAIGEGDRFIPPKPPFWIVPLPNPPLIAVIWRPLAAIPNEIGLTLWWTGSTAAAIAAIVLLFERRPLLTIAVVAALAVPLTVILGVGNVDAFRLLLTIWIWLLVRDGRLALASALLGPLIVIKATPAVLGVWLVARHPRAILPLGAAVAASLLVSVLGAGFDAHLRFLDVIGYTYESGTWDLSIAGIARLAGLPPDVARIVQYAGTAALVVAVALTARSRPGFSFSLAVATTAIGAPAGGWHTFMILIACIAPIAWPVRPATPAPEPEAVRTVEPSRAR
jgi:Glycosyltransferase family 87